MNKCIYLKTGENQTFDKEEHIFPAGLGGIEKLPKGYVSDYVNGEYFSKLELIFMRESPIAIDRMFLGPGKRGNLNKKNATKSKVGIYYDNNNKKDIRLGYIKKGNPYQIPQLRVAYVKENDDLTYNLISDNKKGIDEIDRFVDILEKINGNKDLKKINLYDKSLGEQEFIIGYNKSKIYMLTHNKNINFEYIKETTSKVIKEYRKQKYEKINNKIQPEINLELTFNIDDFYRVCAKIAFNYLASKKGQDYVLNEKFDNIRNFILGKNEKINCKMIDNSLQFSIEFPENSHKILLIQQQEYLCAFISFYGTTNVLVELCDNSLDDIKENYLDNFYGYICDWKSRKEYDLLEFINLKNKDWI